MLGHQVGRRLRALSLRLPATAGLRQAAVQEVAERAAAAGIPHRRPPEEATATTEVHQVAAVRHEAAHRLTPRLLLHHLRVQRQVPAGRITAGAGAAVQHELEGNNQDNEEKNHEINAVNLDHPRGFGIRPRDLHHTGIAEGAVRRGCASIFDVQYRNWSSLSRNGKCVHRSGR